MCVASFIIGFFLGALSSTAIIFLLIGGTKE